MKCEPYRSVGEQDICAVVGHDEPWTEEGCPVGLRQFRQEREGNWTHEQPALVLVCSACPARVEMYADETDRIPLAPIKGWVVAPPMIYCPEHDPRPPKMSTYWYGI